MPQPPQKWDLGSLKVQQHLHKFLLVKLRGKLEEEGSVTLLYRLREVGPKRGDQAESPVFVELEAVRA